MYANYMDAMQWLDDTDVLEMIVDKFNSSDSPEVHANAAEILCAITRYAPPGLAAKIASPSFIGRLFRHALEDSRPKSVLTHSLSVCISLLDPKRLASGPYYTYGRQLSHGPVVTATPETVEGMLESVGELLKLLDVSSAKNILPTTYGKLQPPLGKHRLKIVEFISVLLTIGSEAAEKELIKLGAIQRVLDLFFEYPYNNFLHRHVENIVVSCLESKKLPLVEHLLHDCDLVGKILGAEKNCTLATNPDKPTIPVEGKSPPRIGNIGHITHMANKLVQLGSSNSQIQAYLQENAEWVDWHANVLLKRNTVENVYQWACGRPTALQDRNRDSDDDDFRDRDYDVAALANNLSQAFRYGIYSNEDIEEAHGSLEHDDEDVYFDDESAEVVISSLRLGDEQDSDSLFTNCNWFAFEDDKIASERSSGSLASPSPNAETGVIGSSSDDEVIVGEDDDLVDTATSVQVPKPGPNVEDPSSVVTPDGLSQDLKEEIRPDEGDKSPEWVQWRETSDGGDPSNADHPPLPNGEIEVDSKDQTNNVDTDSSECLPPSTDNVNNSSIKEARDSPETTSENQCLNHSEKSESGDGNSISDPDVEMVGKESSIEAAEHEKKAVEVGEN
ncbi:hypothetical protein NE237_000174 [Protea cynaroides]|uniref:SIT4 phosphatase-associated family protein n=1 Tax=Protea cynaroides TaxID=273540 RepID=A0A9Q0KQQ3_9MAGN|nr:hypothetical protein NE237_000174 [Protea cynaroides]